VSGIRLLDNWSPPDGAGLPVACLATSFTFEADFFAQDCLARFLSLSAVTGEGDAISSIAAVLEEEERLSEAQVTVLVDRSTPAEKRNLRWDVLQVAPPGGLLHAKVAVLLWERAARVILGSANLTAAGYRRQVEIVLAVDLDEGCQVPRTVFDDLFVELRRLIDLVPGSATGARARAFATVDLLADRAAALDLPTGAGRDVRLAIAPSRPGTSPLEKFSTVWRGGQPLWATVLSPYWDGDAEAPAINAIRRRLTGRPASRRATTLVVAVDPFSGSVQAPVSFASFDEIDIVSFDPPDEELRSLHAKLIVLESDEWLAAMVGSSNATEAGLGLHPERGHHELNIWIGCEAGSRTATQLLALARPGESIAADDERWEQVPDEDEPTAPALPAGFVTCTVNPGTSPTALLDLSPRGLPSRWEVRAPTDEQLLTSEEWTIAGCPDFVTVQLPGLVLPAYLIVRWNQDGDRAQATWTANVEDRGALPPPTELTDLPVDVLLAALASTRPLPVALEHELRRRERAEGDGGRIELDPLRRFDDSGLLLQRARQYSVALWRLQERLARPTTTFDGLHWRLYGAIGPIAIADGLVRAAGAGETLPGEADFLLAELALTVGAVKWRDVANGLPRKQVMDLVSNVLSAINERRADLPPLADTALIRYVDDAFEEARR